MMYFSRLPNDALWNIFINTDYDDLFALCPTSSEIYQRICQSREYWTRRFLNEYPDVSNEEIIAFQRGDTPVDIYFDLLLSKWLLERGLLRSDDSLEIIEALLKVIIHLQDEEASSLAT